MDQETINRIKDINKACDTCHDKKIKCKKELLQLDCERCLKFGLECTFNKPIKKRGRKCKSLDTNLYQLNKTLETKSKSMTFHSNSIANIFYSSQNHHNLLLENELNTINIYKNEELKESDENSINYDFHDLMNTNLNINQNSMDWISFNNNNNSKENFNFDHNLYQTPAYSDLNSMFNSYN